MIPRSEEMKFFIFQLESNFQMTVPIFKEFHKHIIGKGGANIRKIREETQTRIDLPGGESGEDKITIIGRKVNVEKAVEQLTKIQNELVRLEKLGWNCILYFQLKMYTAETLITFSVVGSSLLSVTHSMLKTDSKNKNLSIMYFFNAGLLYNKSITINFNKVLLINII